MPFPGSIYAPPGPYTQTFFDSPVQGLAAAVRIPLLIGAGSEILTKVALELVRGSSSSVDQRIVEEDLAGRAVISFDSNTGLVTRGAFNGDIDRIQTKNFPIVTGDGSGTTATNPASINVTVNGLPVVILDVNGEKGILQLSVTPEVSDDVRVTYFFNRTDTRITDDVSDQTSPDAPTVFGQVGENFDVTTDVNDTLVITVDSDTEVTVTISASPTIGWTAAQITAFVNAAATGTSLVAGIAVNNFGETVLSLSADRDIDIGPGNANTTFGFTSGSSTARNKVFYSFQGPIVDGSNGGVTTTDPADVVVKVDGTQVIPTAVDGQSRAITLPFAPEIGAVVTVQYWFNSWQSTFDYLAHRNVVDVFQAGLTPDRNDFVEGADFILKDDLILWGSAFLVEPGEHTSGATFFNEAQVSGSLIDVRSYLTEADPVVDTTVNPPVDSRLVFQLPLQPTTGNGRNSPLGTETFLAVSNNRIDLPTNRPDLVQMYWGFSLSDAVERGPVAVVQVESSSSEVTLAEPVPVGARVYATFYYNTLVDQEYTLTAETAGASGVGTYTVADESGTDRLTPTLGAKSAGLATITLQFPSGTEELPDFRFESPFNATIGPFSGPVEEDVTVTFAVQDATLGKYTTPGSSPYYIISGSSDHFDIEVDGAALAGPGGFVDLSDPTGWGSGFAAQLTGDEIVYDADTGAATYEIDASNNSIDLELDNILIQGVANASAATTAVGYVDALNRAALGDFATAQAATIGTEITLATTASDQDDYYNGWTITITAGTSVGDTRTITDYDGTTNIATVSLTFTAPPDATSVYHVHDPATIPVIRGTTQFLSAVTITLAEYDALVINYVGSVTGATVISCTAADVIVAATYATVATLVTAVQVAVDAAIVTAGGADMAVTVDADSSGRLTFALTVDPTDVDGGYIEFITGASVPVDFAVLAGIDTDTAGGGQAKVVNSYVARRFTIGTAPLANDRIIIRNRLLPGSTGTLDGKSALDLTELKILGGTGAEQAGLTPNEVGFAGIRGTVMEPTVVGLVGLSGGQVPAATYTSASDGQALVTFFADGGTTPQNNVFKFTFEGTPITVVFTDAPAGGTAIALGASADVPIGPVSGVAEATILSQIAAAMTAAGVTGTVVQEGTSIRFRGAGSEASASIFISDGNANDILGFTSGDIFFRTELDTEVLVSALMANNGAGPDPSLLGGWETPGATTFFAGAALAKTERDEANAKYLYLQSLGVVSLGPGTASSIAIAVAATDSVTRPGTGLGLIGGEGNSGEDAVDGFFVISSDPVDGSGSTNDSVLNSGTGQDGNVGATYRDHKTGLTFSLLTVEGGGSYPAGATFVIEVRRVVVTDSNLPVNTIPGLWLTVSNTQGIEPGDTAVVSTFDKGGAEPAVGDIYYVSYDYQKQDFSAQLFTRLSTISAAYGPNGTQNPVVLASYLAIINGAVIIAIQQVQKDIDSDGDGVAESASEQAFINAIDSVEGSLPGGSFPDTLTILKGDSLTLFQYLALHCDVQSSIRLRAERTAIVGTSAGTQPRDVGDIAQAIGRTRLRVVYPDIWTLSVSNADGTTDTFLVDGTYMAAALAGNRSAPTIDVATPWTAARIFGFDEIGRQLSAVEENQTAVRGVTVMSQQARTIKVRQGLTTDMSNILTKLPTVITIHDEVHRQTRNAMGRFVGTKFLPAVTGQIETQLANTLKLLRAGQIIAAYTGVEANVADDDPTVAEARAAYQPVFPLLYIVVTFNLRAAL
jgi:hypothetical protein